MSNIKTNDKLKTFLFYQYPVLIGLFIRTVFFIISSVNKFLYPDEMSFLYNCKTIVENGTDALGQSYPIYFNTWLVGGHSPLPIYITSLSVKLFGANFFALKLPSFILGCVTFIIFSKLIRFLFIDEEKCKTIILLDAFCIGSINMSMFMLDCWWMNYFIIFGLYAFFYGTKNHKNSLIYLSTLFFCLGLYCYIASVFIIPFLLAGLYIVQLKNKKISFKTALLNAAEAAIIALPFIIFGLVAMGIIKPFNFFKVTFPDMSLYTRNSYIAFSPKGIVDGLRATLYNFSALFTFYGIGLDLGIIALIFIFLILTNKVKPNFQKSLDSDVYIPLLFPVIIFVLFTSSEWPYRVASFLCLITIPLYSVMADIINTKLLKRVLFGTMSVIMIFCVVSATLTISNSKFLSLTNYIKKNDIQLTIYTDTPEPDKREENNNYEQAWWSYKFRIEMPDDEYISFKDEQFERYNGDNTVQISDRILITKNKKDIQKDKYLFTLSEDEFKDRELIKAYKNYGAHNDTWFLYSPVK